jgi:hypothetical protein
MALAHGYLRLRGGWNFSTSLREKMRVPFAVRFAGSSPRDSHPRTVAGVTFLILATSEASISSLIVASLFLFVSCCLFT